jgi:hypothetical protein
MPEADHQFRRVNGHLHLPKLRAALEAHFKNVSAASQDEDLKAARRSRGAATEVLRNSGQPPPRIQICLPADDLAEADGNDDGNDGNQSRPQARSGNHPRTGSASGPGQLSHLKSGRSPGAGGRDGVHGSCCSQYEYGPSQL